MIKKTIPIVVAGRNRTRMTIEVIKNFNKFVKDCNPFFIVSSDRSFNGHIEYIDFELSKIGIQHAVYETNSDRYGLGAAVNIGLERALEINDNVFIMENDYLVKKEIELLPYDDILTNSEVGVITFKPICSCSNIVLRRQFFGSVPLYIRLPNNGSSISYTVELGLQFTTKRLFETIGYFRENCTPGEVEFQYTYTHSRLTYNKLIKNRILSTMTEKFFDRSLNTDKNLSYHIGTISQSGTTKWDCPHQYIYLSDELQDKKCIEKFLQNHNNS